MRRKPAPPHDAVGAAFVSSATVDYCFQYEPSGRVERLARRLFRRPMPPKVTVTYYAPEDWSCSFPMTRTELEQNCPSTVIRH